MKTLTVQNTLIYYSVQLKTYQVISMGYKYMYVTSETMPKNNKAVPSLLALVKIF
jgi:hypothetical protein